MDIDIDALRIDLQVDEVVGLRPFGNQVLETFEHRLVEIGVLHETAIDEEELQGTLLSSTFGSTHETRDIHQVVLDLEGQQLLRKALAEKLHDALLVRAGSELQYHRIVVCHRDLDLGMRQSHVLYLLHDVRKLGLVALEELPSSRHIIKEITHLEIGSRGASTGLLSLHLASCQSNQDACLVVAATCTQFDLGDSSHRRQGFASETHRMKVEEVGSLLNLRGGMLLESHSGIGRTHSYAVVDDLNEFTTRLAQHYLYLSGVCVDAVLKEFLDNARRTLNHFASGYLIGN